MGQDANHVHACKRKAEKMPEKDATKEDFSKNVSKKRKGSNHFKVHILELLI